MGVNDGRRGNYSPVVTVPEDDFYDYIDIKLGEHGMDKFKRLLAQQIEESDLILYTLIESGMTYRDLGERLGLSHETIRKRYKATSKKIWNSEDPTNEQLLK